MEGYIFDKKGLKNTLVHRVMGILSFLFFFSFFRRSKKITFCTARIHLNYPGSDHTNQAVSVNGVSLCTGGGVWPEKLHSLMLICIL